jgi:hypothetical protein
MAAELPLELTSTFRSTFTMVWILERNDDVMQCEIRQVANSSDYEFEVRCKRGPQTMRFGSATELINGYLRRQTALQAQGWRPRYTAPEI